MEGGGWVRIIFILLKSAEIYVKSREKRFVCRSFLGDYHDILNYNSNMS
jgi:hypothetical protein